jgi:hypothetical protein
VRAFYSFRSAHHIYFALEYMPGGDLSSMLAECGCIAEPSAAFGAAPEASPLPLPLPLPAEAPPEQSQLSCSQAAKARIAESASSRGREERMFHL